MSVLSLVLVEKEALSLTPAAVALLVIPTLFFRVVDGLVIYLVSLTEI